MTQGDAGRHSGDLRVYAWQIASSIDQYSEPSSQATLKLCHWTRLRIGSATSRISNSVYGNFADLLYLIALRLTELLFMVNRSAGHFSSCNISTSLHQWHLRKVHTFANLQQVECMLDHSSWSDEVLASFKSCHSLLKSCQQHMCMPKKYSDMRDLHDIYMWTAER